jgi:hypothetical protein
MTSSPPRAYSLSVVIPMYEEADNVAPMLARVHEGLQDYKGPWELICVDVSNRRSNRLRGSMRLRRKRWAPAPRDSGGDGRTAAESALPSAGADQTFRCSVAHVRVKGHC